MIRVIIESPYAGEIARNTIYAYECLLHSLKNGEAPIASHLLYPKVLDEHNPLERKWGIDAGLKWAYVAELMAVYTDYGISDGMHNAMSVARKIGLPIEQRQINANITL